MTLYFDSSALIKLFVIEEGSDQAADLWESRQAAASTVLMYPECRAALAAAERSRRLTPEGHRRSLADFERLRREIAVIGVDAALAEQAGDLAAEFGLRGYDAVHLASALALGREGTSVVTWDRDLRGAAAELGLAVAPAG